jgi:hypothetical protein
MLDAYIQGLATKRRDAIAAALRATADQVVPPVNEADIARVENRVVTVYVCGSQDARRRIRSELLAIATELDPTP